MILHIIMEKMDETINQKIYPNEDTMRLFLMIGKKIDMFDTILINTASWNQESRYKSINMIDYLSVLVDYLALPENKSEKERMLKEIMESKKEKSYLIIARKILEIREQGDLNNFEKEVIKRTRDGISKKEEIQMNELLVIPDDIVPERWMVKKIWKKLIHEMFQEKLDTERDIQEKANMIQKKTEQHTIPKKDITEDVEDFKKHL